MQEDYVSLCLRYWLLDSVSPQLSQFLVGVFEIVPRSLLSVFDFQELELVLYGVPQLDVDEWRRATVYRGCYSPSHPAIIWFWEILESFRPEDRAKLLQFVTGTANVPAQGFQALQGSDGTLHLFTVQANICIYV
jgi:hypothetical protein